MTDEEGAVTVWICRVRSRALLDELFAERWTDDDCSESPFSRAFGIEDYDDGFTEVEWHDESSDDLEVLLEGVSYDDVVIPRLLEAGARAPFAANVIARFYNHRVTRPETWSIDGARFHLVGAVSDESRPRAPGSATGDR